MSNEQFSDCGTAYLSYETHNKSMSYSTKTKLILLVAIMSIGPLSALRRRSVSSAMSYRPLTTNRSTPPKKTNPNRIVSASSTSHQTTTLSPKISFSQATNHTIPGSRFVDQLRYSPNTISFKSRKICTSKL